MACTKSLYPGQALLGLVPVPPPQEQQEGHKVSHQQCTTTSGTENVVSIKHLEPYLSSSLPLRCCLLVTGEGVAGRSPLQPPSELATLEDYRARHRLFRTDAALVEMMRRSPVIAIW